MSIDSHLPQLSDLAARLNQETPYRCICRNGGVEIQVADTTIWFDELEAREVLSAVLFVVPQGRRIAARSRARRSAAVQPALR